MSLRTLRNTLDRLPRGALLLAGVIAVHSIVNALCSNALIGDTNRQVMFRICRESGKQVEAALLERLLRSFEASDPCKLGGNTALLEALESIDPKYSSARTGASNTQVDPDRLREVGRSRGVR